MPFPHINCFSKNNTYICFFTFSLARISNCKEVDTISFELNAKPEIIWASFDKLEKCVINK